MSVAFSARVRREREPRFRDNAIKLLAILASTVVLAKIGHLGWLPVVGAAIAGLPGAWRDRTRTQHVVASNAGLQLDGELVTADDIGCAFTWATEETHLRVETRNVVYAIRCDSSKRARSVMRALALDARAPRMHVLQRLAFSSGWTLVLVLAIVAGMYGAAIALRDHFPLFLWGMFFVLGALAVAHYHLRRTEVVVGIDGLSIEARSRTRFIPWSAVRGVRVQHGLVTIELDGDLVTLSTVTGRRDNKAGARASALAAWIDSARDKWTRAPEPAAIGELGAGAFRTTHVADESLWDALRSARTPPDQRVAAAMMLRARVADHDLPKVRVAADTCTTPVRDRIRAVLELDDEELEELAQPRA